MPVKVKTVGAHKNEFLKYLKKLDKENQEKVTKDIEKNAKTHLGKTLNHRDESGSKFFQNATVRVIATYKYMGVGGIKASYRIAVTDGSSNKAHKGWHIIQFGRRENTHIANKHIRYPLRNMRRTRIGKLDVDPFMEMSGQWRSIGEGQYLPGFKGRNWYQRYISDYLKKYFKGSKFQRIYDLSPIEVKGGK